MPEPWLRGPLAGVDPLVAPVFFSFAQAREELRNVVVELAPALIWLRPYGLASLGFHLRHIAGSIDRLSTYLKGQELTEGQLEFLRAEAEPGAGPEELLVELDAVFGRVEEYLRTLDLTQLGEPRTVGRARLPSTVQGLLVHIAEHTQRHVGQAVTTGRLLRALTASSPAESGT